MKALRENFNGIVIFLFELVIGILLLINPVGFTTGIIIAAGIILVLNGLINCIKYFRTDVKEASKGQFLTKGLIAVIAGAFCILNTDWFIVTFSALTVIYGVIVLLASVEKIQLCVDLLRQKRKKWYLAAISAVISLVCAAIILKNPFSSTTLIWIVAGISLILEAIFDMYTLLENCRKQEAKIEKKEVRNKTEKKEKSEMYPEEVNEDAANASEANASDGINSGEVNNDAVNASDVNSGEVKTSDTANAAEANASDKINSGEVKTSDAANACNINSGEVKISDAANARDEINSGEAKTSDAANASDVNSGEVKTSDAANACNVNSGEVKTSHAANACNVNSGEVKISHAANSAKANARDEINSAEVNVENTKTEEITSEDSTGKKKRTWNLRKK